jgi:hypothetical protein
MESELQRQCATMMIESIEEKLIDATKLQSSVLPLTLQMIDLEGDEDMEETARVWLPVLTSLCTLIKPNVIQVTVTLRIHLLFHVCIR